MKRFLLSRQLFKYGIAIVAICIFQRPLVYGQAPTLSYTNPQTYPIGTAIAPLTPASSGVAARGYGSPVNFGSVTGNPYGVTTDAAGNLYVTDKINNEIKKFPANGGNPVTIAAGLNSPLGIASDAAGNVYWADAFSNSVKMVPAAGGSPITIASGLSSPKGVAIDAAGNVYVANYNDAAITKIPPNGNKYLIGSGLSHPLSIAVDGPGNIYVGDQGFTAIRKIPSAGGAAVPIASGFPYPYGLAVDAAGNLFVANNSSSFAAPAAVTMIPAGGSPVIIGAAFNGPNGVTADRSGNIYVADNNGSLWKSTPAGGYFLSPALPAGLAFDSNTGIITGTPAVLSSANYTITAYNSNGGTSATVHIQTGMLPAISYAGPQTFVVGTAITALVPLSAGVSSYGLSSPAILGSGFLAPTRAIADASGNVYVADYANNLVKKILIGGGPPVTIGSGFNHPIDIAFDAAGNVFVADQGNNAVKKIPVEGGSPVTLASLSSMGGMVLDKAGNIYVTNYVSGEIKKIPAGGGAVVTVASGFYTPLGIAIDAAGNLYIAENGASQVQKVPVGGGSNVIIGTNANFTNPYSVAVDAAGNVFVADAGSNSVKKIPAGGGSPVVIASGLNSPKGVWADAANNIYIADTDNNQVKEIKQVGGYFISPRLPAGLSFDVATGIIGGTATAASPAIDYIVIAYNAQGSSSAAINIQTAFNPPPVINYSSTNLYAAGSAITPLVPVSSGVAALAYGSPVVMYAGYVNAAAADAVGNVYTTDYNTIKKFPAGGGDPVNMALGGYFYGMATDPAGNLYVADNASNTVKKIPADGGAIVTIASGIYPLELATDAAANVYVSTSEQVLYKIPADGGPTTTRGQGLYLTEIAADGAGNVYAGTLRGGMIKIPAAAGSPVEAVVSGFLAPTTVAVDAAGNIFTADDYNSEYNSALLKMIPAATGVPVTIASGIYPYTVAAGVAGNLYISNVHAETNTYNFLHIKPSGGYFIRPSLPAGLKFDSNTGTISGTPAAQSPATIYTITAYNANGASSTTTSIQIKPVPVISYGSPQSYFTGEAITALSPASQYVSSSLGYSSSPVTLGPGMGVPTGIAVDISGNVYVADNHSHSLIKFPAGGGASVSLGSGFDQPNGLALDRMGNLYVSDIGTNNVYKVNVNDGSKTIIGTGFSRPYGIAADAAGNIYVADLLNSTVKMIPAGGGAITTIGAGFASPGGVALDAAGNIYVADYGHSAVKMIPVGGGAISTIASGLNGPIGVATDVAGNLFIANLADHEIKMIPAGSNVPVNIGSGFQNPTGIAAMGGKIYVADQGHNAIKQITPTGGYYLSAALPAGLSFDNTTGTITGTPLFVSATTNYTISAYNETGSGQANLSIQVVPFPPPVIAYSSPLTYLNGTAITPLGPVATGVAPPVYTNSPVTLTSGNYGIRGVAVDAAGSVYFGDDKHSLIMKIPAGGGVPVSVGTVVEPAGMAVDNAGNIYVASGGSYLTKLPAAGGDPVILDLGFNQAQGVAVDAAGNVYVADYGDNAVYKIVAGSNSKVMIGSGFSLVMGVALDAAGNVYTANYGSNSVSKIPAGGGAIVTIGPGFDHPLGVATDAAGNILVTDLENVTMIPAGGGVPVILGSGFGEPWGITTDRAGNVYVADHDHSAIKEITFIGGYTISPSLPLGLTFANSTGIIGGTPSTGSPATDYTVTGSNRAGPSSAVVNIKVLQFPPPLISYSNPQTYAAGVAITALVPAGSGVAAFGYSDGPVNIGSGFNHPYGVASDAAGNVYVADQLNGVVKKIPAGGGSPVTIGSGTGVNTPNGIAVDAAGNVYLADGGSSSIIKFPAGGGSPVNIGSGFAGANGVAVDVSGNVYVADFSANMVFKVPVGGGGPVAIGSGFNHPAGVAVDAAGNVYVADFYNDDVKKIPVNGGAIVSVGAGFSHPVALAIDGAGNIFVADPGNNAVKMIAALNGATITIASGFAPSGVGVDAAGNVYAGDKPGTTVKQITPVGGYYLSAPLAAGLSFDNNTGIITGTPARVSPAANYMVTAYNSSGGTPATLNITIAANANLSGLSLSSGALNPAFASGTTNYTASVGNAVTSVTLTPATSDAAATVMVNGITLTSGTASASLPLTVGQNIITSIVTAQDGTITKTYTVTVTRAASGNASLSNLKINGGTITLNPAFNSNTNAYTATVSNATNSISLTPTTTESHATVAVNGTTVASGTPSNAIALNIGANTITTIVSAQNGTTTNTYTITITRAALSIATLASLHLSNGALSPAFASGTTGYSATVGNTVASVTVTAKLSDATATLTVNGNAAASNTPSSPVALTPGPNTINVVVTAQDGVTTKTYTITLTRALSSNASLSALSLNTGSLSPKFIPATTSYTEIAARSIAAVRVKPVSAEANATMKVNGVTVASGAASQAISLGPNNTVITTIVTAPDGITQKTYSITVARPSTNASLSALSLNTGSLSPAFDATTTGYTETVANTVTAVRAKPIAADATSTIKVNGAKVTSGGSSAAIALNVGANTITTVVTAQDGIATKTYIITVTRTAAALNALYQPEGVESLVGNPRLEDVGLIIHPAISPNGDGQNDHLIIDGISNYPDNSVRIVSRSGVLVYEANGYNNSSQVFDGHSNKSGKMQQPGTYFYSLAYKVKGATKYKTGFIILKY